MFSENGFSSIREVAPPEEPELFLKESEPCQTGPNKLQLLFLKPVSKEL